MCFSFVTVFNRASDWGYEQPNPVKGVKRFKEHARERFLQSDEMPRLFRALELEENEAARGFFLMCLFTGARKSNVLAMRWEEVNVEQKTWTIPMTKNGDRHTVPLVDVAFELLKVRQERCWRRLGMGILETCRGMFLVIPVFSVLSPREFLNQHFK